MALQTQRIILRTPTTDDDETLISIFTDPETMRHLPVLLNQPWDTPRMAARREARAQDEVLGRARTFTVVTSPGQAVIGHAVFKRLWEDETLKKRRGEVGVILARAQQGRGLAWDVHLLLLTLGFEELGLEIVEWVTGRENEGMRAVLRKMPGCQDAGPWVDDEWVQYILEKKDWVDCKRWLCERVDQLAASSPNCDTSS